MIHQPCAAYAAAVVNIIVNKSELKEVKCFLSTSVKLNQHKIQRGEENVKVDANAGT